MRALEQTQPVAMSKYGKSDCKEEDQHDEAASASTARATAAEAKTPLEPSKCPIEKEEFEQTSQTSLTITHNILLGILNIQV
jgi:hypothetical protein